MAADFGTLDSLITKWDEVHRSMEKLPDRVGDEVLKPLKDKGYWEGAAAPYAWTQIDDIQRQVALAVKVAEAVKKVLTDGVGELKAARTEVKGAISRAKEKGLYVYPDGRVSKVAKDGVCTVDGPTADDVKVIDQAQDEIIAALRKAHLADENLALTLMQNVGVGGWFNNKPLLTDINHTDSISTAQTNALHLAMDGKDPHPSRNDDDPYDLGIDFATGTGDKHQDFTNGDRFTELIQRSESMKDIRKQTLDGWKNGEGNGDAAYSISKDGYFGAGKKLILEDLPAIVTGDDDGLGQAYLGSYNVKYEVTGEHPDGSVTVRYTLDNTTSVASVTHYLGYHSWQDKLNHDSGPTRNITQTVTWTEVLNPDGTRKE
ncbi:hypothetical protein [Streptomyces palmae]|uniref:Uncharacterized protein n=1 Tax=Streptomyces palmae TaxID=1701085 RepID=A0A4Z0H5N7_9ACTN|nr:hypothetical protein [Streptomyces palmae]TGB06941.1 hypothetical protein E4099_17825 [Streptomyces palmae]